MARGIEWLKRLEYLLEATHYPKLFEHPTAPGGAPDDGQGLVHGGSIARYPRSLVKPLGRAHAAYLPTISGTAAPRLRIGIGFTSSGRRSKQIGECWDNRCSEDGHFEIFIRPDLDEPKDLLPMQVAAILGHELVHAAVGIAAGHGREFRRVAKGLGLAGPMAATTAGPGFEKAMQPILQAAGPLPHGRLRLAGGASSHSARRNPQHPRRVKCACANCGYTIHTTGKWLALAGAPLCPNHGRMQIEQPRAPVAVSGIAPPATLALEAIDNKR